MEDCQFTLILTRHIFSQEIVLESNYCKLTVHFLVYTTLEPVTPLAFINVIKKKALTVHHRLSWTGRSSETLSS